MLLHLRHPLAFHINSVDEGPDGRLLISARNMWAIFDVSKKSGRIRYQIGGKKSDFTFGPNADFYWQHDARCRPGNRISMFDDGCCDLPDGAPEQRSHGLILDLDFRSRKATVHRSYYQPPLESPTQGNTQALFNGNEFIGWGPEPVLLGVRGCGEHRGQRLTEPALRREAARRRHLVPSVSERVDRHAVLPTERGRTVRRRAQRRLRLPERLDADQSMAGVGRTYPRLPVGRRPTRPSVRIRDRRHDERPRAVLPGKGAGQSGQGPSVLPRRDSLQATLASASSPMRTCGGSALPRTVENCPDP
ncbi:arylsulfotransferase family protein [Streptomyces sp. CoT10]|uniref:arylsulfotransferase family protein n=1 Tax=Streptomyces sp. CoT10 TaxID=2875762 RepID=UPI001CD214DE|nr:arylsulfotransferase family protein [Streptomyces sp. CoT10]